MDQLVVGTCTVLQNLLSLSLAFQMSHLIIKRIKWILNLTEPEQKKKLKKCVSTKSTNSVTSNFFPNETLTGCPFFFTHFWNRGTYKTLQHVISLQQYKFCMFPDSKSEWKENGQPVRVSFGKKLLVTELVL